MSEGNMEFKGTPGPWFVDVNGVQARWNIDDVNGASVALTHQVPNDKGWSKRDANTRLIAAAPEMLEVLQLIVDAQLLPVYHQALVRAAISKALGEE